MRFILVQPTHRIEHPSSVRPSPAVLPFCAATCRHSQRCP
jgi:hypothetical protein